MSADASPEPDDGSCRVVARGRSVVGRQRSDNQDAFSMIGLGAGAEAAPGDGEGLLGGWPELPTSSRLDAEGPGFLFLVADGMGGAAAGEIASRLAVTTVQDVVTAGWDRASSGEAPPTPGSLAELLREAALEANRRIHKWGDRHAEYRGMGSTLTAVGVVGRTAVVAQVGDSRAYLVRDGRAAQLTEDQTMARKLVESGSLAPEEADESSQAHLLLQALGTDPEVRPELDTRPLRPEDDLVICSDGLSETVAASEMGEVLADGPDLGRAADVLIDRANEAGGPDNITVVLARIHFPREADGGPS